MKQTILVIVVMFLIATFFIISNRKTPEQKINNDNKNDIQVSNLSNKVQDEVRAMYFSYIELESYLKDKSEQVIKTNIDTIINNMSKDGYNWLILHVRPFSDSIYPSKIFPLSSSITSDLSFDILAYFIEKAHEKNIEVHAWINPYRISSSTDFIIDEKHPAHKFLNTDNIKVIEGKGIYYNPASEEVIDLIVTGIEEIINNYDIDGIHFDDYFYPSSDIDNDSYQKYQQSGGNLSHDEYRLENTTKLIKKVYESIKKLDKDVMFGVAPEGNINNNYTSNYLDVKKLLSTSGYIDYIMPQIYFGFLNGSRPFTENIQEWNDLIKDKAIKLIPALALYKAGKEDSYAGSGNKEWMNEKDILKRQIIYARNISNYKGFAIFRYDFFYNEDKQNENTIAEVQNIRSILKD